MPFHYIVPSPSTALVEMNEVQARQVILGTITKKNVVRNEKPSIFRYIY